MIEPRIYRAAFVPALLAVVVAMFSLESRPAPRPQGLAADVLFDGRLAGVDAQRIAREAPDRPPGSAGDRALAARVARELSESGFTVVRDRFERGGEELVNVVGRRAGASRDGIAVIAARDSRAGPDLTGSAADTAALLELARTIKGRPSERTLVLASVDGGALGHAGARRLVEKLQDRDRLEAAIVLSDLGARRSRGPVLMAWSGDSKRAGIGLQRTAAVSLREELGALPRDESAAGQLARLAFPLGIGAQGVLLKGGVQAVRISGSGELPPPAGERGAEELGAGRLGALGRAALRTLSALDAGPEPRRGPRSYAIVARQVLPGWALALLALTLIAPPLAASVDAFARARRRREPASGAWRLPAAGALAFGAGLAVAELLVLVRVAPAAPAAAPVPADYPLDARAAISLAVVAAAVAGALALVRRRVLAGGAARDAPSPDGAATGTALLLSLAVLAVWALNPFAALVALPALHLWTLGLLAEPPPRRPAAVALLAAGLAPPAALALFYLVRLSLDPLEGAWYLFLLVTGHHVGLVSALLACAALGVTLAVARVLALRAASRPAEPSVPAGPPIRGPGNYVGPGSLGDT